VSKKDQEIKNEELKLIPKCKIVGVRKEGERRFDYMFCETHENRALNKKCCGMEGAFKGDLKELMRYIGGGSVEMDGEGEIVRVVGSGKWEEDGKWYGDIMSVCWVPMGDYMWIGKVEKVGTGRVCYK